MRKVVRRIIFFCQLTAKKYPDSGCINYVLDTASVQVLELRFIHICYDMLVVMLLLTKGWTHDLSRIILGTGIFIILYCIQPVIPDVFSEPGNAKLSGRG